jgi:ABC-type Fe3+/spermidine/putrescine transport system ATPase subunit
MTAAIELDQVTKKFAGGVVAVDDVTLTIARGIHGARGSLRLRKSTLLRMIAGLEEVTDGAISIGGGT